MSATRPPGFQCPWCGPDGLPVDHSLPAHLRLCDDCESHRREAEAATWATCLGCLLPYICDGSSGCDICAERGRRKQAEREAHIASLRAIFREFVREDFLGRRCWPGAEWAKITMGNALLGSLENLGCDMAAEIRAATGAL